MQKIPLFSWLSLAVQYLLVLFFLCAMKNQNKKVDSQLENLGKRLRSLRKAKGFKNYELFAYQNDINRVQYGGYEQGKDLRVSTLFKLISAFGLTPAEFFKEGFEIPDGNSE